MEPAVVVGALARIVPSRRHEAMRALAHYAGVSTFELELDGMLGVLVEAETLNVAHSLIAESVSDTPGVLGVWPVSVEVDPEAGASHEVPLEPIVVDEEYDEHHTS